VALQVMTSWIQVSEDSDFSRKGKMRNEQYRTQIKSNERSMLIRLQEVKNLQPRRNQAAPV